MKYRLRLYREDCFATPFMNLPACNPVGFIFYYNNKSYKIIDAIYDANDNNNELILSLPLLTVVEIPT